MLVPVHLGGDKGDQTGATSDLHVAESEKNVMVDLVDQLAALDAKSSG